MQTSWPLRVLILDDHPADAERMLDALRQAGFEPEGQRVATAAEYAACLDPQLDIILSDYQLAQTDVQTALYLLQEHALDVPFLIVADETPEEQIAQAIKQGAASFVCKEQLGRLGVAVERALQSKKLRDQQRRADDAARAREELYGLITDNVTDMISRQSPDDVFLVASPACRDLLGYEPDELVGQPYRDFVHPEDLDAYGKNRVASNYLSTAVTISYRFRRKEGDYVWLATTSQTLHDASGAVQEIFAVSHEMTSRKQAAIALLEERNLLRTLIDNLPDYIFTKDTEGRFVISNLAHAQAVQLEPEALIGKTASELFAPELAAQYDADDQEVLVKGRTLVNIERISTDGDGNKRAVLSTKVPVRDVNGQIVGLVGVSRDVTDRKRAEEALKESEISFRHLFANNPYPMYVFDRETLAFLDVNEAFMRHYGYSREELMQLRIIDIRPEEDVPLVVAAVAARQDQSIIVKEWQHRVKDGRLIDVEVNSYGLHFAGRDAYLVVAQDITERKRAQAALIEEHNLLSTLIDALPDAVYVKDLAGRIILDNIRNNRNMGLIARPNETYGKTDFDFHPRELAEQFWADERRIMETGEPLVDHEEPDVDPQGNMGWHLTTKVPLRDRAGKVMGIVGVSRDITERKRAALALAEDRNLLRTLIDNLPQLIYVKDSESRIILCNMALAEFMGATSPEELVGKTDFDYYPEELASKYFANEQRVFQSGQPTVNIELPSIDTKGNPGWLSTTQVPVFDKEGHVAALVGIDHDITDRKRAEEQLRQSEATEREQRILADALRDTTTALTSTLDPEMVMARILENVGHVVPHDSANIMLIEGDSARPVYWRTESPDNVAFLKKLRLSLDAADLRAIINTGEPIIIADTLPDPDWKYKPLRSHVGAPIRVNDAIIGFLNLDSATPGFFTESHAERLQAFANQAAIAIENAQLYDELNRYTNVLEQQVEARTAELSKALVKERGLNDLKSRFVSMISHEFRTPLAAIQVASDLLRTYSDKMTEEQKLHRFAKIAAEIKQMTSMLEKVLTLDRAETGQLDFTPESLDLEAFCRTMVEEVQVTTQTSDRLVLAVEGACGKPPMDEKLLKHIFTNLLINAVKFSPTNSTIRWDVECLPTQTVFRVHDEGIGIPADDQKRLFEPFHRARNVGQNLGTGLGLAIVKQAVDLHCGTITFESELGKGTTFTVTIPRT